jgi:Ca2+-binding RTX toxin-like protein
MLYPKQSYYPDIIDYLNAVSLYLKSLHIPDSTRYSTNDVINGTSHKDNLKGTKHDDDIYGKGGNDTLSGLQGDDYLYGQNGNDKLIGGAGDDNLNGGAGNDNLNGSAGDDELNGDKGNDTLIGGTGVDSLHGGDGNDNLNGGAGNDELYGNSGKDTLIGGAGDDSLYGGLTSLLTGGTGKDTFELTSLSGDIITDFSVKDDEIWLSKGEDGLDFLELQYSDLEIYFKIGEAASYWDKLLYNSDTGVLSYDADGNGQGEATEIAVIGSHLELTYADFSITEFI